MLGPTSELQTDAKTFSQPQSRNRNARTSMDGDQAKPTPSRRRRDKTETSGTNTDARYFLSSDAGKEGAPAIGRECSSEAEAMIEAFRARTNFYRITEFHTLAHVSPSGDPVLKKEVIRKSSPAS